MEKLVSTDLMDSSSSTSKERIAAHAHSVLLLYTNTHYY